MMAAPRRRLHLGCCGALAIAAAGGPLPASGQPARGAVDLRAVDAYVIEQMQNAGVPGVSIAITSGGRVLYQRGFGRNADGSPVTVDTPFYIASLSKAFTATAVLQLAAAGAVELDRPVQHFMPEFVTADPRGASITVRHLLTHASGLTDRYNPQWDWPQPASLEEWVARLRTVRLADDPGTRFSYHNPNYVVAARLVEVVSGRPFPTYLREQVLTPIGMTHTRTVDVMDEARDRTPRGHVFAFGRAISAPAPAFFINGAGGVISTARDMAIWLAMQTDGGATAGGGRASTAGAFRGVQDLAAMQSRDEEYRYQFGWSLRPGRRPPITHRGNLPTYNAYIGFEPGGSGVVVLMNAAPMMATWSGAGGVAEGIHALLRGDPPPPSPSRTAVLVDACVAFLALLFGTFAVVTCCRVRQWHARFQRRPAWQAAANLGTYAALVAAAIVGIPVLVGPGESWSWVWFAYYSPVFVASVIVTCGGAAAILMTRVVVLLRPHPTAPVGTP